MANFMDFSSDTINVFFMNIDSSGSMSEHSSKVITGLNQFIKSFNNFSEAGSIVVSPSQFASDFYPAEFCLVKDMSMRYIPNGATALYYSIVKGAEYLKNYVHEIAQKKGISPNSTTFIVFSDGEPCQDPGIKHDAQKAIESLNMAGINTAFVAFGDAIDSEFGKDLGFAATIDVSNLVEFLGVTLPNSCKQQSKSHKPLMGNFFSQAANSTNSKGYSQGTTQALDDLAFIDDI